MQNVVRGPQAFKERIVHKIGLKLNFRWVIDDFRQGIAIKIIGQPRFGMVLWNDDGPLVADVMITGNKCVGL